MGMERLPAGGQHVDAWTSSEYGRDELSTGGEQMLTVVQHDQQGPMAQLVDQRLPCGPVPRRNPT